jgi:hypothetical protein
VSSLGRIFERQERRTERNLEPRLVGRVGGGLQHAIRLSFDEEEVANMERRR